MPREIAPFLNRRSPTKCNPAHIRGLEAHGYHHNLAPRGRHGGQSLSTDNTEEPN